MLDELKTIAPVIVAAIGLFTLVKALIEYKRRNMLTRIDLYLTMRDKFARDPDVQKVCAALGGGSPNTHELEYTEKRLFLGTMETVALMVNSKTINKHVAMYMFGYYVLAAWDSDEFWSDGNLKRDDPSWGLFKSFAEDLRGIRRRYESSPATTIRKEFNFYR